MFTGSAIQKLEENCFSTKKICLQQQKMNGNNVIIV